MFWKPLKGGLNPSPLKGGGLSLQPEKGVKLAPPRNNILAGDTRKGLPKGRISSPLKEKFIIWKGEPPKTFRFKGGTRPGLKKGGNFPDTQNVPKISKESLTLGKFGLNKIWAPKIWVPQKEINFSLKKKGVSLPQKTLSV